MRAIESWVTFDKTQLLLIPSVKHPYIYRVQMYPWMYVAFESNRMRTSKSWVTFDKTQLLLIISVKHPYILFRRLSMYMCNSNSLACFGIEKQSRFIVLIQHQTRVSVLLLCSNCATAITIAPKQVHINIGLWKPKSKRLLMPLIIHLYLFTHWYHTELDG